MMNDDLLNLMLKDGILLFNQWPKLTLIIILFFFVVVLLFHLCNWCFLSFFLLFFDLFICFTFLNVCFCFFPLLLDVTWCIYISCLFFLLSVVVCILWFDPLFLFRPQHWVMDVSLYYFLYLFVYLFDQFVVCLPVHQLFWDHSVLKVIQLKGESSLFLFLVKICIWSGRLGVSCSW